MTLPDAILTAPRQKLAASRHFQKGQIRRLLRMRIQPFHRSVERYTCAHAHADGQLIVITKGACQLETDDGSWPLSSGNVGWIPSNERHWVDVIDAVEGASLFVPISEVGRWPTEVRHGLADRFFLDLVKRAISVRFHAERLAALLAVIADEFADMSAARPPVPMPLSSSLHRICRSVLDAPDERVTIDVICRQIGWSRRTFERRFVEETGMSFGRWRTLAKVAAAAAAIESGEPITTAAFEAGFSSSSAFGAAFRSVTGLRPSEYRNRFNKAMQTP